MSTLGATNGSSLVFGEVDEEDSSSIYTNSSNAMLPSTDVFESAVLSQDTPCHWNGGNTDIATSIQDPTGPVEHGVEQVFSHSTHGRLIDETTAPDLSLLVSAFSPSLQDCEGECTDTKSNSPTQFEWDVPVVPTMDTLSTPDLNAPLFPMYDYIDVDVPLAKEKTDTSFSSLGHAPYPLACL